MYRNPNFDHEKDVEFICSSNKWLLSLEKHRIQFVSLCLTVNDVSIFPLEPFRHLINHPSFLKIISIYEAKPTVFNNSTLKVHHSPHPYHNYIFREANFKSTSLSHDETFYRKMVIMLHAASISVYCTITKGKFTPQTLRDETLWGRAIHQCNTEFGNKSFTWSILFLIKYALKFLSASLCFISAVAPLLAWINVNPSMDT